jgi:hypothetical protein
MTRSILASSVAACICLGLATPLFAAEPTATGAANPPAAAEKTAAAQPAQQCLTDLRAFDSQMQKDGYWLSGSGYGYGYPDDGRLRPRLRLPRRAASRRRARPATGTRGPATMSGP